MIGWCVAMGGGAVLAWRPFLEPAPVDEWWLVFCLPVLLAVAVVVKTLRGTPLRRLSVEAVRLVMQILFFMIIAAGLMVAAANWL